MSRRVAVVLPGCAFGGGLAVSDEYLASEYEEWLEALAEAEYESEMINEHS
jgi:hypothetical protein